MISLFIALLLLLGLNAIFRASSQTVQAGNALSTAVRNARAVTPEFFNDLSNCAPDSPAFIITSCFVPQYLNAADAAANNATAGTVPTFTVPVNGVMTTYPVTGCELGDHLHRADMLMFFARGLYKRKTADTGYLVSTTTSNEAFIHYGHLAVIANDGITPVAPDTNLTGVVTPYAANWTLGRNAILMADATNVLPNAKDLGSTAENYIKSAYAPKVGGVTNPFFNVPAANIAPLGFSGLSTDATKSQLQSSRYDLAGQTIDEYRSTIENAVYQQNLNGFGGSPYYAWWAPLVYNQPFTGGAYVAGFTSESPYNGAHYPNSPSGSPAGPYPPLLMFSGQKAGLPGQQGLPLGTSTARFRFQASSVLSPQPESSLDQAGLSPYMLDHVSQFIVEYAGDFLSQNSYGNITDTVPDGQIDWVYATKGVWQTFGSYSPGDWVIRKGLYYQANFANSAEDPSLSPTNPNSTPANQPYWTGAVAGGNYPPKAIRWYGMPRNATGSGTVYGAAGVIGVSPGGTLGTGMLDGYDPTSGITDANALNNVVPLGDVWLLSLKNNKRPLPYEVQLPGPSSNAITGGTTPIQDYAAPVTNQIAKTLLNPAVAEYTAVWQNNTPAMVRILLKIDDPNNAMQNGPWFEYVFKLK